LKAGRRGPALPTVSVHRLAADGLLPQRLVFRQRTYGVAVLFGDDDACDRLHLDLILFGKLFYRDPAAIGSINLLVLSIWSHLALPRFETATLERVAPTRNNAPEFVM